MCSSGSVLRTLQTLKYAPEDPETVLLLLHASLAPAVVQGALLHGLYGAAALALRLGPGDRAEVALPARHALPHLPVLGAAGGLLQTLLAGLYAVQARGLGGGGGGWWPAVTPQGEQRLWGGHKRGDTCAFTVPTESFNTISHFTQESLQLSARSPNDPNPSRASGLERRVRLA